MVTGVGEIKVKEGKDIEELEYGYQDARPKKYTRDILLWASLIISILASAAVFWGIFRQINDQNILTQRLDALEGYISKSNSDKIVDNDYALQLIDTRLKKFQDELQAIKQNQSEIDSDLSTLRQLNQSNQMALSELSLSNKSIIDLSEVLFLLKVADQRLRIMGDVDSAVAIGSRVDEVLIKSSRSGLDLVRQALAEDLAKLRSQQIEASEDVISTLSILISQIESLEILEPLSMRNMESEQVEKIHGDKKLEFTFAEALKKLSNFIVVRKRDVTYDKILDPKYEMLLKENIISLLRYAKLAVLTKDSAFYKLSLDQADILLREIKIPKSTTLLQIQNDISLLKEISIIQKSLNFSESIRELDKVINRNIKENRE